MQILVLGCGGQRMKVLGMRQLLALFFLNEGSSFRIEGMEGKLSY